MLLKPRYPKLNAQHPLAKGLVGAWPASEGGGLVLRDASGQQAHGTLTGTVNWRAGQTGSSLNFTNAATSRVALPQIIKQNTFTIAAWIYPTSSQDDNGAAIFYQGAGGGTAGTDFLYVDGASLNASALFIRYEGGGFAQTPANSITKNFWNRVLWSFNAGAAQVFINGVLQLTASGLGSGAPAANGASIGQWYNFTDSQRDFIGQIDGVSVWSRPLNPAEAVRDYSDSFAIYRAKRWAPRFKSGASGAAVGAAAGVGAATGVGASAAKSPGAASGTGTATGVGASAAAAVGNASGTGTATGVGASAAGAGAASGTGAATGVGASAAAAVGAASGTGAASGVSPAVSSTNYASARSNAIPAIPEDGEVDPQTLRTRLLMISRTINLLLRGKANVVTTLTLTASATSTTLTDERIGPASYIALSPLTENATILDLAPYISSRSSGSAVITHGSTTAVDCTYSVLILG